MNPEVPADSAVLASAVLTLLAIATKLITANLVTRSKGIYTKLDARRREIVARLKEAQLKRTSAKGTMEFWERRRKETSQRVQDAIRDLEALETQYGALEAMAPVGDGAAVGAQGPVGEEPATQSVAAGEASAAPQTGDGQAAPEGGPAQEGAGPDEPPTAGDKAPSV